MEKEGILPEVVKPSETKVCTDCVLEEEVGCSPAVGTSHVAEKGGTGLARGSAFPGKP